MNFVVKSRNSLEIKKGGSITSGFTLLELIGVMVVIAILTAAVLPSTIDLIQVQRSVNEGTKLPQVAEALKRGMLREQVFPIYENSYGVPTDGNDGYWWNLASRHGGGSANEVRYPLGVRPGSDNTRKLFFAQSSWGDDTLDFDFGNGVSFSAITGSGFGKSDPDDPTNASTGWISPEKPYELRFLLLSTTGTDLPLPDTLSTARFDALWDDWSIGSDGNPATLEWFNYGLNEADWKGRATELNVQRIDLREWLSAVVIENRRAIQEGPGDGFDRADYPDLSGNWVADSLYAYAENLVDCEVLIKKSSAGSSGSPPVDLVNIDEVILLRRGKYILDDRTPIDESNKPSVVVVGDKFETDSSGAIIQSPTEISFPLTLTDRSESLDIGGWNNGNFYIQERYFLPGQELSIREPLSGNQDEVGIFVIEEGFSTLRFDGRQWEY